MFVKIKNYSNGLVLGIGCGLLFQVGCVAAVEMPTRSEPPVAEEMLENISVEEDLSDKHYIYRSYYEQSKIGMTLRKAKQRLDIIEQQIQQEKDK